MNKTSPLKNGVTLTEIIIGILVLGVIFAGLMRLVTTGMRGASKGMSHLGIMQSASILMSQIEYDLLRATSIEFPAPGERSSSSQWNMLFLENNLPQNALVSYNQMSRGIERHIDITDSGFQDRYNYGSEYRLEVSFKHILIPDEIKAFSRSAMLVEITITSDERMYGDREKFSLKRLITSKNIQVES